MNDTARTSRDRDRSAQRAALASLLAALFLTLLKLAVGLYTNSLAILSEALHSGLDLAAALMTWYAIRVAARPADSGHPYGHGKAENLSALAETLLLLVVCVYVGYEGVHRLVEESTPVVPSLWGVGIMLVSVAVDLNRVRVLRKAAKETRSQALEADALHFSTDILSSSVVLVGVLAVWLGDFLGLSGQARRLLAQADTVAALVVAFIILCVSLSMARRALNLLMDAGSKDLEARVETAVAAVAGVAGMSRLRLRSSGAKYFVDLCVGVDPGLRVSEGHRIASNVQAAVQAVVPDADVTVHVDPVAGKEEGGIAAMVLREAGTAGLAVHDLHLLDRGNGQVRAEIVVEFPGSLAYGQAHARTAAFEASLRRREPGLELVTHLAPESLSREAREYSPDENALARTAWEQVQAVVGRQAALARPHAFRFSVQPGLGACLSFHCTLAVEGTVEGVHDMASRMEQELRESLPVLGRVVIHIDPPLPSDPE